MKQRAVKALQDNSKDLLLYGDSINAEKLLAMCNELLRAFGRTWQEIMLCAAIEFALDELGVSKVFYHSFETGNQLKNIGYTKPPKSLYTKLPKRFCFVETTEIPNFLAKERRVKRQIRKAKEIRFFYLASTIN